MTLRVSSPERSAQNVGMAALVAMAASALLARQIHPDPMGDGEPVASELAIVEVRGAVPAPGFYALDGPASVADALRAAGLEADQAPAGALAGSVRTGDRLTRGEDGLQLGRTEAALTLGVPLDLNAASAVALESLPGIGARKAADIVADRELRGAFRSLDDLDRVRGIGPATVNRLRPWLVVGPDLVARAP